MACIGGLKHHGGADQTTAELANWNPPRVSFDDSHLREKDQLDARTISSSRDYPLVANAFRRRIHRIIGPNYRVEFNPISEFLPIDGLEGENLAEYWMDFAYNAEMMFQADNQHPEFVDIRRQSNFTQLIAQMCSTENHTGEALYTMPFMRRGVIEGKRPFGTTIQTIDPARVYNPSGLSASAQERTTAGFEFDRNGYAHAMYVNDELKRSQYGRYSSPKKQRSKPWDRVRKQVDGTTQFVFVYDSQFPGMSRGRNHFSSALNFTRMLHMAEQMVLRATRIQAQYAAYIKTQFPDVAAKGLYAPEDMILASMQGHKAFYKGNMPKFAGEEVKFVMPGDEFVYTQPNQPIETFPDFRNSMFTHIAAGAQMGYSTFSGDYLRASFASVQAERLDNYQTDQYIKANIIDAAASPYVKVWLEENISNGRLPIRGLSTSRQRRKYFRDHSSFLANFCFWGAPRESTDPVKQAVADNLEMDGGSGSKTRQHHLNQRYNMSIREWTRKKKREREMMLEAGLDYLVEESGDISNSSGRVRTQGETMRKIATLLGEIHEQNGFEIENDGQNKPA